MGEIEREEGVGEAEVRGEVAGGHSEAVESAGVGEGVGAVLLGGGEEQEREVVGRDEAEEGREAAGGDVREEGVEEAGGERGVG